ncbi:MULTISPECIES: hypothetical protein [unclassified Streptomyces]|uniref:hypothetical protein n=1 Tax=unclassified Streptomyces TaxID=2593676 RepID=UPI000CD4D1A2|nr:MULTISPECIES: hypothetical protein [unclassified Streptomyces]
MTHLRAHALRLPADQIHIGDYLTFGGHTSRVTFAEHRGGLTRLELDADTRLTLKPTTHLTITRPTPPRPRP